MCAADIHTSDDAEFMAEMRGEFLENISGELDDCEGSLLRFEKTGSEADLAEFKRLVHSIKGGARMVALNDLSNHFHGLETKLQKCAQEGRLKEFVHFCLPFIDGLKALAGALRDDGDVEAASAALVKALTSFS